MVIISENYPMEVQASEGYYLTNGEIYTTYIVLSNIDRIENWTEIPEEEVPVEDGLPIESSLLN